MFGIVFYYNKSEPNRMDKTDYLQSRFTLQGTLKDGASIISPIILIQMEDVGSIQNINYAYIEIFKRYYYINNIVSVRNNLWEIYMSVDVLMSFRGDRSTGILSNFGMITRNEFEYSDEISDVLLPNYTTRISHDIFECSELTYKDNDTGTEYVYNTLSDVRYYIRFFGSFNWGDNSNGLPTMTGEDNPIFPKVANLVRGSQVVEIDRTVFNGIFSEDLQTFQLDELFSEQGSLITSIKAMPFSFYKVAENICTNLGSGAYGGSIYLKSVGKITLPNEVDIELTVLIPESSDVIGGGFNITAGHIRLVSKIPNSIGNSSQLSIDFKDYEPYSTYSIYLPFYGFVDVSIDVLLRFPYIVYDIDVDGNFLITFTTTYPDYDERLSGYGLQFSGNCAVDIPISYTGISNAVKNGIGFVSKIAAAIITKGSSLAVDELAYKQKYTKTAKKRRSSSPKLKLMSAELEAERSAIAGDVINSTGQFLNGLEFGGTTKHDATSAMEFYSSGRPFIIKKYREFIDINDTVYNNLYGKPLGKILQLYRVKGFTIVNDIHLENISCMDSELDEIYQLLKDGVILPDNSTN